MLRLLSYFSFIGSILGQFRDPVLTIAPPTVRPIVTFGPVVPVRTIGPILTTIQNITTTISTTTTQTTTQTTSTQTNEPENVEEINTDLFYIIIPSGMLLLFFIYLCLKKRKQHVNVVNIDLNIENKIPAQQEPTRQTSNLSDHFYEEINYEARYEMPNMQNASIEENEYGTQVTTSV